MKYSIEIKEEAMVEISEAYNWYEEQQPNLGESFLKQLENLIDFIQKVPSGFIQFGFYRQAPVKKFPFVVIYEIEASKIIIYAVFHTSRNPKDKLR